MSEEVSESIKITGLRKTKRQLKELDAAAAKELRSLEQSAAKQVATGAREGAPVGGDDDPHAGALKGTIRTGVTAKGAFVKAGGKLVAYAGAIHWGWHRRHIKPNKFIYRAFDRERPVIEATFVRQIESLVRRTVHGNGED